MTGTWVLLRGLTRGSGHWAGFAQQLQRRLRAARVVTLDTPGNGALHAACSPASIEAMAQACRAQLRALDVVKPLHLLGVSMGALVALDWSAREPGAIDGCVLVNASVRGISPLQQRLRPSSWAALLRIGLLPGSSLATERAILRLTSRDPSAAAAVLDAWAGLRAAQPITAGNALRQLLAAARFEPPPQPPPVPLLILSSLGDALVDARCSRALARRWGCASAVHPDAGHDLTLDDGAWVAEHIAAWLERKPAGAAQADVARLP